MRIQRLATVEQLLPTRAAHLRGASEPTPLIALSLSVLGSLPLKILRPRGGKTKKIYLITVKKKINYEG